MMYYSLEHFKGLAGYDINGVWYPRVTKIVEIKAKPQLYKFYAEMSNFNEGEAVKKQSADEGTKIHETVEQILIGKTPEIDLKIKPAIDSFRQFLEQKRIQVDPAYVEKRIANDEERYAGTIDSLAVIDGKFGVLDIKTSQAIYKDYDLQTAAYLAALQKNVQRPQTRWILRIDQAKVCLKCGAILREKGGRQKIKLPYHNGAYDKQALTCQHEWSSTQGQIELKESPYWQKDYQAFLGAKKLWEWENEYWLKQIGYL